MSWVTSIFKRRNVSAETVALSTIYLGNRLGIKITDANADEGKKAALKLANDIEVLVKAYVALRVPGVGAGVIALAVTAMFNVLDAAISGLADSVKANN